MNMEISANLQKLAQQFNTVKATLYVVGGAVRNYYLGLPIDDIDLCGSLTPNDMMDVCTKCGFKSQVVNEKLGTVLITASDTERYEYTTWRSENYTKGHTPDEVVFVDDIHKDARRRDFTIGAIYYDILTGEFVDIYNGKKDIEGRVIRTIETPNIVFSSDGLRLLRMVRFASELNFKVDKLTLHSARDYMNMLADISKERKLKELKLILFSDFRYGKQNKCIKYFNYLDVYKYLFKTNKLIIKQNKLAHRVMSSTLNVRYLAFVCLVLLHKYKFKSMPCHQIEFDVLNIFGSAGLGDSNANVQDILHTYVCLQTFYLSRKYNIINLVEYAKLNEKCKKTLELFVNTSKIDKVIAKLKGSGMPFSEDELDITNEEILKLVPAKHVSGAKKTLFNLCLQGKLTNVKQQLTQCLAHIAKNIDNNK